MLIIVSKHFYMQMDINCQMGLLCLIIIAGLRTHSRRRACRLKTLIEIKLTLGSMRLTLLFGGDLIPKRCVFPPQSNMKKVWATIRRPERSEPKGVWGDWAPQEEGPSEGIRSESGEFPSPIFEHPGPKDLLVSHRTSWGILPQTPVFSLRSARCHWESSHSWSVFY
jgi:hypothetical protein